MNVVYTAEFRKQFYELPVEIQEAYREQETLIAINPFDSRLHAKPLKGFGRLSFV